MKEKVIVIAIVILCFQFSVCFAQNRTIRGRVIDENQHPLCGVTVLADGQNEISSVTSEDGEFKIEVSSSVSLLCFHKQGMKKASASIDIYDEMVVKMVTSTSAKNSDCSLEELLEMPVEDKTRSTTNQLTSVKL